MDSSLRGLVTVPFNVVWFVGSVFVCAGPETFTFVEIYFHTRCALVSDCVKRLDQSSHLPQLSV